MKRKEEETRMGERSEGERVMLVKRREMRRKRRAVMTREKWLRMLKALLRL